MTHAGSMTHHHTGKQHHPKTTITHAPSCSGMDSRRRHEHRWAHALVIHPVWNGLHHVGEQRAGAVDKLGKLVDLSQHARLDKLSYPSRGGFALCERELDLEDGVGEARDLSAAHRQGGVAVPPAWCVRVEALGLMELVLMIVSVGLVGLAINVVMKFLMTMIKMMAV